jgi:hypothetical protein
MRRRTRVQPPFSLPANAWRDAFRAWEVAFTAPQVIAMRTARMAAAGSRPSSRDRAEVRRMGAEKQQAFGEAWTAMAVEAWLYPWKVAAAMARSNPFAPTPLPLPQTFGKALAPVHQRVRANAKRLSRGRKGSK